MQNSCVSEALFPSLGPLNALPCENIKNVFGSLVERCWTRCAEVPTLPLHFSRTDAGCVRACLHASVCACMCVHACVCMCGICADHRLQGNCGTLPKITHEIDKQVLSLPPGCTQGNREWFGRLLTLTPQPSVCLAPEPQLGLPTHPWCSAPGCPRPGQNSHARKAGFRRQLCSQLLCRVGEGSKARQVCHHSTEKADPTCLCPHCPVPLLRFPPGNWPGDLPEPRDAAMAWGAGRSLARLAWVVHSAL